MEHQAQKYILLQVDGRCVRCCIKRIVCIVSQNEKCFVYERLRNSSAVRLVESTYRLSWFREQIHDPRFFNIFRGIVYNTRFYLAHDSERIIYSDADGVPRLVVAVSALKDFREHLKKW
ncbi:MAG: hypothetical protein H6603_11365 [Flavobacteriales bacterium]|nr:hypothetical protein [Flavobacteriales bacterium]